MGIFKLNGIDYMGGGDGGNANEQVLTWAEYCALTEEEKANGTTYYITDINGEGKDGFQPVIYSTEEREIGVWTDGKSLYEKTIVNELTLTSSWQQYTSSSNMDTIVSVNCNYLRDGENTCGAFSTNEIAPWLNRNNYIQVCGTGSATNGWKIISMTIRYTKTTDQPSSGTWTPQGTPAMHYSTDEQVIGTWYNGKTLYEKVVVFSSPINMTGSGVTISEFSTTGIEDVIQCDCFRDHDSQYGSGCSAVLATIYNGNLVLYDANGLSLATGLKIQYTKTSS